MPTIPQAVAHGFVLFSDLLPWFATAFKDYTNPAIRRFASFNASTIEELRAK